MERVNGRLKFWSLIGAGVLFIITTTVLIEDRYAKASDVEPIKASVSSLVAAMTIQQVTRQTVLNLKKAGGSITPEEQVELDGIDKVLDALAGKTQ